MDNNKDSEDTGPSVDSEDRDERIAARRIRIAKRAETQRRAKLGVDPDEMKIVKEELSKSRKQMEDSRILLTKLVEDGTNMITNVKVAAHAREGQRRIEEEEASRQRREKEETVSKTGKERFEEITRKWEIAMQKEIPHELHEMLTQQRHACDALRDEKNKLIYDLEMELKRKDEQYVKDLKKFEKDIDLLTERNNEQVKELTLSYRRELEQIEKAFVAERTDIKEQYGKKWDDMMRERSEKEVNFLNACQKRVEDYEKQLQQLRVMDAEEYCKTKIRVEKDLQVLQQQMQQMKATYQLNQEKLDYNFNVLRKRDEENTVTKSQQKRKITRIQDVLTNLRSKLAKQEKQYADENAQLAEEYRRITEHLHDLQKKSKHFMATDAKQFRDIWIMNEEEAKAYVAKLLEADRIIFEQQLGLQWQPPDLEFMNNVGPLKDKRKMSLRSAKSVAQELISSASVDDYNEAIYAEEGELDSRTSRRKMLAKKLPGKLVKQILELLCDESDFLVENKLQTLLQPLQKDEQCLMKLDAVFAALGVETEEDVYALSTYFIAPSSSGKRLASGKSSVGVGPDGGVINRENDASLNKTDQSIGSTMLEANEVVKALRQFVEDHRQTEKEDAESKQFKLQALEARDDSNDAAYWAMYPAVISGDRADLWDALTECFLKYSEILLARSTLLNENDALRQQNTELRVLLHQYMASKVNQELQIPPTRVLHLEAGQARV